MSQYRTGKVAAVNGSSYVYGNSATDWSSVRAGHYFTATGERVGYDVAAVTSAANDGLSPSAWSTGSYSPGALVSYDGSYYVCVAATTQSPGAASWVNVGTSRWRITLTAPYQGLSGEKAYSLTIDFSRNYSLPIPAPGDVDTGVAMARAFNKIDALLAGLGSPGYTDSHLMREDFTALSSSAWATANISGTPVLNVTTEPPSPMLTLPLRKSHPGIIALKGDASTVQEVCSCSSASYNPYVIPVSACPFDLTVIFLMRSLSTEFFIGFNDGTPGVIATSHTNAIGMYHAANGPLRLYQRSAGGTPTQDTIVSVPATDTWYRLRLRQIPDSAGIRIGCSINSGSELVTSPPSEMADRSVKLSFQSKGASSNLWIDYVSLLITGLGR